MSEEENDQQDASAANPSPAEIDMRFINDLTAVLNTHNIDGRTGIPDHILAWKLFNIATELGDLRESLGRHFDWLEDK